MPIHHSAWTKFKRGVAYSVVGTVGMKTNDHMGRIWGIQGIKDAHKAYKQMDENQSNEVLTNMSFLAVIKKYEAQLTDDDKSQLNVIVKGYFDNNRGGKVSLVKDVQDHKKLDRIQILGPPDDWVTIWSAA